MSSQARRERLALIAEQVVEPCRRYLVRRTDATTADDVLSEVLLVCWRRIDEVPDEPLPWAYGVARRALANADRAARRQRRVGAKLAALPREHRATDDADPQAAVEGADVRQALSALPERDAELLRLWAWEDLAPGQIAAVLGISSNAATLRLRRAKDKLATALGEGGRQVGPGAGHKQSTTPPGRSRR